jgi:hypothetical protein
MFCWATNITTVALRWSRRDPVARICRCLERGGWQPEALPSPGRSTSGRSWASRVAKNRNPEDRGIGDTIYRAIGPSNFGMFKKWFKTITGRGCGCDEWRAK